MATKIWKHRNTSDGWSLASEWITSEFPAAGDGVVPAGSTTPDAVTGNATRSSPVLESSTLGTNGGNGNATLAPSANQTLEIGGTDTDTMTVVTSSGPALSISSTFFTDTGLTATVTSGGQTKDNTLALTGTVSDVNGLNLVQIYDGATLLGTANFTAESWTNWGFVTPALPDGSHSFTAKVTDSAGNTTTTSAVTVTIDATPPSVKSVSSRISGSVKTSQVVKITLNMSEKVFVSGTPELLLNDGGTATYASGSGTRALTFEYIVPSDQGASDLQVIGVTLPSPTAIQDLLGNAADLSAAEADLHLKVGSTTTTPATSLTLTGIQQTELFGPSSASVTFASGATGSLILDASSQFTGTISGLSAVAPFNAIDLADIAFGTNTTAVYLASGPNTGTLTVSDGTHTANIALSGQYGPTSFTIASDGHGGTAVVDPVNNVSGSWSGVFSWPFIGIQSAILPDGKVLTYGTDQNGLQGAYKIFDVWDPITNTHNTLPNQTLVDEFCSAVQIIPTTNEVLIAGGDNRPNGKVNVGIPNTNIFDVETDSLTPSPFGPMAYARWYPTLITLGTGQLLILGGADIEGTGVGTPEIFTPGAGWRTLTGAYIGEMAAETGYYYPRTWLASDGRVITIAAGFPDIYAIDTSGNGHVSLIGQAPFGFNFNEPAIMFAQDKCLVLWSDGSCWVMNISGPTPVFTPTGSLAPDRIWSNLTVLPDGRVMVSGGSQVDNQLTGVEYTVAIWDPSTGLWTSTGANAAVPRLYHSTAILLPDATVLSLGGGGVDPDVPSMNHLNGEIYTPGYLFDASGAAVVRPIIQQAPPDLSPGQTFTVRVDNPANIRTLALMPFGSTTHGFNATARRIELSFSVQADGSLSVTLPANSNIVPPGDWMLFAIGNNGAPSTASTIHVNPYLSLSNTIGTDTGLAATITGGDITRDNTLALSGTLSVAKGFSSVQVYDGATLLGPATISSGNWSYTTTALPGGSHSFTAKATDNAGNTTTTFAVTATVDATPPTETISTTINTNTGATTTITSGGVTKDNTLGLSGTVSDAGGVSSVQIYDGATLLGPALFTDNNAAGYAFNEATGTTTADATGHGITGTLVNGATFTTAGKYGNAVALDGINDYVGLGNPAALQLTGSMAVSAWIYATAFPGDDAAVVSTRDSSEHGFQLDTTVDTGGRTIGFKLKNSSGGAMIRYGATTLQTNTWYYITGVYDAASQTLHVYLNGQLDDGQLVGTVTATQQSSSLDVEIGQNPGAAGAYQFNGRIDDVRIADHAITQSQIQTDMATPLVAGNWSYTTTALPDGSHSFTAKATDNAGNTTTTSAVTATVNTGQVDTTPPSATISTTINTNTGATTTITSGGVTKDNTLGLSGTVSDAGGVSSVQIYDGATLLGPATISSGNWSYTTTALPDGSHSFTAKATDNAGNTTTTTAVTATVDATPPTETISTTINTNTGATTTISSGGVTKDNTLGLSGTVSDAGGVSSVQIYDGATLLGPALFTDNNAAGYAFNEATGTTTADTTGHGITGTLVNGATFTTAGKYGNAVALDGINDYVDLGSPAALQLTGSMAVSAWIYATAFPGDDAAVVSTRDSSEHGFQLDTTVDTGGRTIGFKLKNSSGGAMIRYGATTLQTNTWYYITGVYDAASQTLHVYLNGQLDDGQLVGTVTATQQSSSLDVEIGQNPGAPGAYQFNGRIDDVRIADHAITQSQIQTDMATPLVAGNWSYTTTALPDGSHSFTAKATDNAGNTTTTSAVTATVNTGQVDTTPPSATISTTINTNTGATTTISSGGVTKDNTLGLSGTVSDAGGVSSVQIYDGATLLGPATISSGNWSYTTTALPDGSHSFTAKATDNAGNTTTTSAVTATVNTGQVDTTPPAATISTTINTNTGATTTITSGGVTKDNTLGLSGTVSDAGGVSSVQIYDGATLLGPATISSGNWSYTTTALPDGSHSFTAKATDNAGNTTTTTAVTATVDATPPTETISTTINTNTGATTTISSGGVTKDNTLGLSGTVSDAGGVSSVQIYDGATLLGPATISSGNWSYTTTALPDGSHSFTAKATDNAGNTTTTSAVTATVNTGQVDTTPPSATISTTINTNTGATTTITSGGVTKDNTLGLSGTVSDAGGVSSVQIYDGATLLGPALFTDNNAAGYAFNEATGTTTADTTGHGITGTLVNGATFTTAGKYGNAVALDGINDYVDLGSPAALQLTGSMAVSAWIYATAFPGDDAAVVSTRDSSEHGFQLDTTVDTGGRTIGFKLKNSSGGAMIRYGATTLQTNTWYYITGVYDAASQTLHVYLNGQLDDGQLVGTVTATQQSSSLDVEIGQNPGAPGAYQFNGRIDDVRIADHAITQSQIQTDMATPLVAGNWSYTTTALPDGSHSFTAKATDNAGNTTTTSAVTATVNTGQVGTPPAPASITSVALSGGLWKLSGSAAAVSTVTAFDGPTKLGTTTADSSGSWSFPTQENNSVIRDFLATVTDAAGNTSAASAAWFEGTTGNDVFSFVSEAALVAPAAIFGNGGSDTIAITAPATLADADFAHAHNILTLLLTGASAVTLGASAAAAGIANVTIGNGATSITDNNTGTLNVNAGALAAAALLTLSGSEKFAVTGLQGNLAATNVTGALDVTTAAASALSIATGGGTDTITASAMTQGETLALTGSHAATVAVGGNLAAGAYTGKLTVTASGTAPHAITTGTGADSITAAHGADTVTAGAAADTINVSGHTLADSFVYQTVADSHNTSSGHDTITGFLAGTGTGAINDTLDFSAILGPTYNLQSLGSTSTKVNPDSIAWMYSSSANQTLVYVNATAGALSQTSNQLMEVALTGNIHLTAANLIG